MHYQSILKTQSLTFFVNLGNTQISDAEFTLSSSKLHE